MDTVKKLIFVILISSAAACPVSFADDVSCKTDPLRTLATVVQKSKDPKKEAALVLKQVNSFKGKEATDLAANLSAELGAVLSVADGIGKAHNRKPRGIDHLITAENSAVAICQAVVQFAAARNLTSNPPACSSCCGSEGVDALNATECCTSLLTFFGLEAGWSEETCQVMHEAMSAKCQASLGQTSPECTFFRSGASDSSALPPKDCSKLTQYHYECSPNGDCVPQCNTTKNDQVDMCTPGDKSCKDLAPGCFYGKCQLVAKRGRTNFYPCSDQTQCTRSACASGRCETSSNHLHPKHQCSIAADCAEEKYRPECVPGGGCKMRRGYGKPEGDCTFCLNCQPPKVAQGENCVCPAGHVEEGSSGCRACPPKSRLIAGKCTCNIGMEFASSNESDGCVCRGELVPRGDECWCPEGKMQSQDKCLTCPKGASVVAGQCQCPATQVVLDGPPPKCGCPEGSAVGANGQCIECPADAKVDPATKACDCGPGKVVQQNVGSKPTCVCKMNGLPPGPGGCQCPYGEVMKADGTCTACPQQLDPASGDCRCIPPAPAGSSVVYNLDGTWRCECPVGSEPVAVSNLGPVCLDSCPAERVRDPRTLLCMCPVGTIPEGKEACVEAPPQPTAPPVPTATAVPTNTPRPTPVIKETSIPAPE